VATRTGRDDGAWNCLVTPWGADCEKLRLSRIAIAPGRRRRAVRGSRDDRTRGGRPSRSPLSRTNLPRDPARIPIARRPDSVATARRARGLELGFGEPPRPPADAAIELQLVDPAYDAEAGPAVRAANRQSQDDPKHTARRRDKAVDTLVAVEAETPRAWRHSRWRRPENVASLLARYAEEEHAGQRERRIDTRVFLVRGFRR
jgi:hypothetical protein